jgi:heme exporter protein D
MFFEFINFDGYGIFIWPSYIFTFVVLSFLFIKTKNSLKSYEKKYSREFEFLTSRKVTLNDQKRNTGSVISHTTKV